MTEKRPVPTGEVRVGDADRERAADVLREHTVEGRLTLEEYGDRLDLVYEATGEGELVEAMRNLPEQVEPAPEGKRRSFFVTLLGSVQRTGRWTAPRRIWAFSLVGAPDLDFRQASVSGDVKVTTISLMGALTAIVPAGIHVEVSGLALLGGNDVVGGGEQPHAGGGPTIRIRSYAVLGGARVTCLPSQPELPR